MTVRKPWWSLLVENNFKNAFGMSGIFALPNVSPLYSTEKSLFIPLIPTEKPTLYFHQRCRLMVVFNGCSSGSRFELPQKSYLIRPSMEVRCVFHKNATFANLKVQGVIHKRWLTWKTKRKRVEIKCIRTFSSKQVLFWAILSHREQSWFDSDSCSTKSDLVADHPYIFLPKGIIFCVLVCAWLFMLSFEFNDLSKQSQWTWGQKNE